MENNFTEEQLTELSTFIREDELNSDNFVVTDIMTDEERFDMLNKMLEYGEEELYKIATPQLSFSADMNNIFVIPDFDIYSFDFDVGNYIWVTLRDDYSVKAKLLDIHVNYYDVSDFSVTFGNIVRKAKEIYTDIQDIINDVHSAATSVSFNQSNWNKASKDADNITQMLADGLLSHENYIATSAENSDFLIDKRGCFVNTTTGSHANKDSIFIGGGRILFTDDNWKTVAMAVGRADVNGESRFGVFADFCIASYIAGSTIESTEIKTSTITSTDFNNGNGTFHVDKNGNLTANSAKIKGEVTASKISGSEVIGSLINNGNGTFSVDKNGKLTASDAHITKGTIGGAVIENYSIKSSNGNWYINSDGTTSFTKPYISGVQPGSSFGSIGFNGASTWGNFGGNSYFGSTANNPFSGKCIDHIKSLSVDVLNANIGNFGYVTADEIYAQYINSIEGDIDTLYGNYAEITNIVAQKIDASTIYADFMEVENWTSAGYIRADRIDASQIFGDVDSNVISVNSIFLNRLNIYEGMTFLGKKVVPKYDLSIGATILTLVDEDETEGYLLSNEQN